MTIAIIGAGMAGLSCAQQLHQAGHEVVLFDKARGPGGRMASRRSDRGPIDHGAQYFTARDPQFVQAVHSWEQAGLVAEWHGNIAYLAEGTQKAAKTEQRYCGVPRMSALTRALSADFTVHAQQRISSIKQLADGYELANESGDTNGPFSHVVVAVPADQAVPLLTAMPEWQALVQDVRMDPCWALLAYYDETVELDWDAAFVEDTCLAWAARDSSKPQREAGERWIFHANETWTQAHLELTPDNTAKLLLQEIQRLLPAAAQPSRAQAHRWRFAKPATCLGESHLWSAERGLGVCGDWCVDARVEAAWLSGFQLGNTIKATLSAS